MTNNQLTKEWLQNRIADMESTRDDIPFGFDEDGNNELAAFKLALTAMDSEPVAWTWHHPKQWHVTNDEERVRDLVWDGVKVEPLYRHAQPAKGLELAGWQFKSVNGDWLGLIDEHGKNQAVREGCEVREVFAMADGVNERAQVRREHAEWSQATFGNVGPIGPLKHLRKEALEAIAKPQDLIEWADMQFLLWDAQRRAGITDEQITQAMIEKLAVNKQREWPAPKDGEPRLHIKELPAPVVPDEAQSRAIFEKWCSVNIERNKWHPEFYAHLPAREQWAAWEACRAAMLQAGDTVRDLSTPVDPQVAEYEQNVMQAGNSPVIPDGYVMVPKEPTERMVIAGFESEPDEGFSELQVWEAYEDMSGCEQAAYRARLCWAAMLAAAPQEVKP